jgi:glucokinase
MWGHQPRSFAFAQLGRLSRASSDKFLSKHGLNDLYHFGRAAAFDEDEKKMDWEISQRATEFPYHTISEDGQGKFSSSTPKVFMDLPLKTDRQGYCCSSYQPL